MAAISASLKSKTAYEVAELKAKLVTTFLKDPLSGGLELPYSFTDKKTGLNITVKTIKYDGKRKLAVFPDLEATTEKGDAIKLDLPFEIYNPILYVPSETLTTTIVDRVTGNKIIVPKMVEDPVAGMKISLVRMIQRCM
jgi:hypothetical protein